MNGPRDIDVKSGRPPWHAVPQALRERLEKLRIMTDEQWEVSTAVDLVNFNEDDLLKAVQLARGDLDNIKRDLAERTYDLQCRMRAYRSHRRVLQVVRQAAITKLGLESPWDPAMPMTSESDAQTAIARAISISGEIT